MSKTNLFTKVQMTNPKSNVFDLSHDFKLTANMGNLVPTLALECVPGDKHTLSCDSLVRFAPLIAPVMHRIDFSMHYFFVPNRLIWSNWEKWITRELEVDPPTLIVDNGLTQGQQKFLDYIGIPPWDANSTTAEEVSALPMAAYQCIYNEYYRDENLIPEIDYQLVNGNANDPNKLCEMRKRAWEHDYFTSCLPFAQKGAAVDIPLGDIELKSSWTGTPHFQDTTGVNKSGPLDQTGTIPPQIEVGLDGLKTAYDPDGTLQATPTTINDLRRAFRLQEFLEKNARGGTRYIENILAHFGVQSDDARMNRPEYITGVRSPIVISEVLNSTGGNVGLPQGNMAGHGVNVTTGKNGSYYVKEHGYIIGVMSIMPKPAYQQGIPRTFLKKDPLDYYWPSFAHIGEQEIQNSELFAFQANGTETFGYLPRYTEYKFMPNRTAGDFRGNLDYWTLTRQFANQPTLSQEFIEMQSDDINGRIFAVDPEVNDNLYIHLYHKIKSVRKMPYFGNPML